jgi:hypothetical protein
MPTKNKDIQKAYSESEKRKAKEGMRVEGDAAQAPKPRLDRPPRNVQPNKALPPKG